MPPTQAGSAAPFTGGTPLLLLNLSSQGTAIGGEYLANTLGQLPVITGIDAVAAFANPVQCFFHADYGPNNQGSFPFYYDSQSTGEGNGVWFSWRGALPLPIGSIFSVNGQSVSTISWSCVAYGIMLPLQK